MNGLRTTAVLLAVFCVIGVARPVNAYDLHSGLRVFPYEGRPGSIMYLSGYGLRPLAKLYIMIACPNFQQAHGNLVIIAPPFSPKTDSSGEFAGWRMKAPKLTGVVSSGCFVYAEDDKLQTQTYGPTQFGQYYILGPRDPVRPCDVRICATITPTPKRVKTGRIEKVDVQAWAGARADVTVTYPGHAQVVQAVTLDWNGSGTVHVPVPKDMKDSSRVRITVHCRLGHVTGDRKAEFTVVH